jgi:hypothetical protein
MPYMVEGFIYRDPVELNVDGSYVKISNLQYIIEREDFIEIGTVTCAYRLMKNQECKE